MEASLMSRANNVLESRPKDGAGLHQLAHEVIELHYETKDHLTIPDHTVA
jgi:hypothetical protein